MTNSNRFSAAGEALFGPEWRRELGRRLNVNERQIRRWANGEYDPPASVLVDIGGLCAAQSAVLAKLATELRAIDAR